MKWNEEVNCRKARRVLKYHVQNEDRCPEKFAHHLLFMFYPFRSDDALSTEKLLTYQNTAWPSILNAVNKNRQKFEPYVDIDEGAVRIWDQIKIPVAKEKMMKLKIQVLVIKTKILPMWIQMNTHQYLLMH